MGRFQETSAIKDVTSIDARLHHKFREEFDKTVHLSAAGDSGTQTLVRSAQALLLGNLLGTSLPVEFDGLPHIHWQLRQGAVRFWHSSEGSELCFEASTRE